jgi:hypothetical protein
MITWCLSPDNEGVEPCFIFVKMEALQLFSEDEELS